jgi:ribonucrease Y
MLSEAWLLSAAFAVVGAGVVYAFSRVKEQALRAELKVKEREAAEQVRRDGESARVQARLSAQEESARWRADQDRELESARQRVAVSEARVAEREASVGRQMDRLAAQEADFKQRGEALESVRATLERDREEVRRLSEDRRSQLERLSHLNAVEARTLLLKEVEQEAASDAVNLTRHIMEKARTGAEEQSRRIIATAIQRYAGRHTFETSTATVALTGDEMKGRIIGRDGRNIRAFENATGITVLVDDTPNAVVLSGFDPVRREIARQSMERLILDGRIHPTRIEEVVAAVNQEMDGFILRKGEEAIYKAGQPPMHPDVTRMLGRLHFRHSYSQNVLDHSIEVAHLAGLMAAELGEDSAQARRSGLLHDIGKAMSHEVEGPHAIVGAEFLKRLGETPVIVNAVASHHDEVPHETIFGILVAAADAISASRPGSRSESMTTYLQRLENLERIALDFEGVERAFAIQAGRELRVVVKPESVDDRESLRLARDIARRIEDQLLYPGQIRITVIRETRCVEYAK